MDKILNYKDYFYECSIPVNNWVRGTYSLEEMWNRLIVTVLQ
jgi:hypothetical protein